MSPGTQIQRLQQFFPNRLTEAQIGNSPNEVVFYVFHLPGKTFEKQQWPFLCFLPREELTGIL
jgi:hypothetical protein